MASLAPLLTLNNGRPFPILGYGTWAWGASCDRKVFADTVYEAIAAGYRHIDTAWIYKVEKEVGAGVRRAIAEGIIKREEVVIVTKVASTHLTKERVKQSALESNEALGLGYIDVLLIHCPVPLENRPPPPGQPIALDEEGNLYIDDSIDIYKETWPAMEALVDAGLVKSIGVSNFSTDQVRTLVSGCRIKPVVNQVECHPILPQEKMLEVCKELGIVVTAYSPFAGSPMPQPDGSFAPCPLKQRLFESKVVPRLAQKYGKTAAQVLLKFHTARGVAVIPKAITKSRIWENMNIFDFELTEEDLHAFTSLATNDRCFPMPGLKRSKYNPFTN